MPAPRSRVLRGLAATLALVGLIAVVAACSSSTPTAAPKSTTTTTAPAPGATVAPLANCDDKQTQGPTAAVASFKPDGSLPAPGAMPPGSYMAEIYQRGYLIVGASADTYHMGFRNPLTGVIEGFDVDQLKRVAAAIFPDGATNPDRIHFKVVTYAQRIPSLLDGSVDIVAHSMTINCSRWAQIDFSTEYYHAGQKVLVRSDSNAEGIDDLKGQRVCTQKGTTSIDTLETFPDITIVAVDDVSACLVKFQTGEADAISGDDTVLAGFVAQDPYAKVVGDSFSSEPYGMGINKAHPEFVQFVNAVLDKSRNDGSWAASYKQWLSTSPTDTGTMPPAVYGREPSA